MADGRIIDTAWHPLASGIAPPWASGWGQDEYGVFVEITVKGVTQALRWCPPGRFLMGSPKEEPGRFQNEGPQTEIIFVQGFWLFEAPVTQALYSVVMDNNPSRFMSPDRPVERVNWEDAQIFLAALNDQLPSLALRLPSEAEWEYACRARTEEATYAGSMIPGEEEASRTLDAIAWYRGNSGQGFDLVKDALHGTHPVKRKIPNSWGLHDMLGNVWEWCADEWADSHTGSKPTGMARGVLAPEDDQGRVVRGGAWGDLAQNCRSAIRGRNAPGNRGGDLGFRPAQGQG